MDYHDHIYGSFDLTEPVLLDLINTSAMHRLHGVLQHGISGLIGVTRATTRFEHSMGVMLLVRRLGGSLEEQIAALLHDVSHTAFSHVIDYVFDNHDLQSYHDENKETFVASTDIPSTLIRHGYDWCQFICLQDEEMAIQFPLLEQPAPALCADRLDYFLRDSLDLGLASSADNQLALDHLTVHNRRIVIDDLPTAGWVAATYIAADRASWANFREVGLYELTARAIKRALMLGILNDQDLWGTDRPAWDKLTATNDTEIRTILSLVHTETRFARDDSNPTFRVSTKLRTLDPVVLIENAEYILSSLDMDFAELRTKYLTSQSGKWPMRVIPAGGAESSLKFF